MRYVAWTGPVVLWPTVATTRNPRNPPQPTSRLAPRPQPPSGLSVRECFRHPWLWINQLPVENNVETLAGDHGMRQTTDQRVATQALRAQAGYYRVTLDTEGWPI